MQCVIIKDLTAFRQLSEVIEEDDPDSKKPKKIKKAAKTGRIFYSNKKKKDADKSFSILTDTNGLDELIEANPDIVEVCSVDELLGIAQYDDDGEFTGYTPRHPLYTVYKLIWDNIPDTDEEGTRPPLLPHAILAQGNSDQLNMEP